MTGQLGNMISNKYEILSKISECDVGTIYCVKDTAAENQFTMIKFKDGFIDYFGADYLKKRFYDISRINSDYVCKPLNLDVDKNGYCLYRNFGKTCLKHQLSKFKVQQKLHVIYDILLSMIKAHDKLVFLGPISIDDIYCINDRVQVLPYWLEYPAFNYKNFSDNQNKYIFLNKGIKRGEKISIKSDIFYMALTFNYILFEDYNNINETEIDKELVSMVQIIKNMLSGQYISVDYIYDDFVSAYNIEQTVSYTEECGQDKTDNKFSELLVVENDDLRTVTVTALKYLRQLLNNGDINKFLIDSKQYLISDRIYRNASIDENLICRCIKICMENYRFDIIAEFINKLSKDSIKYKYYNAYSEGSLQIKIEYITEAIESLNKVLVTSTYKDNLQAKIIILKLIYFKRMKDYNKIISIEADLKKKEFKISVESYYKIYKWMGEALNSVAKNHQAIAYFKKCLSYIEKQTNRINAICESLCMLGKAEYATHKLYDGINYYRRAAIICESSNNSFYQVDLYFGLFNCFIDMGEFEKAATYVDKLEELSKKTKRMWEYIRYISAKLVYFIHIYRYDKALKCVNIFTELQKKQLGEKGDFLNRATETEIYLAMGKTQEANTIISICREILNDNPNNVYYNFKFKYITALYLYTLKRYNDAYSIVQNLDENNIAIEDSIKLKLLTAKVLKYITVEKAYDLICSLENYMSNSQAKYYHIETLAEKARILKMLDNKNEFEKTIDQFMDQIRRVNIYENGDFSDIIEAAKTSRYEIMRKTARRIFESANYSTDYEKFITVLELINKMENEQLESQRQLNMLENIIKISQNSIENFNYEYIKTSFAEQLMHISNAEIVKIYLLNGDKLEKICQTSILGDVYSDNEKEEIKNITGHTINTQMEIYTEEQSSLITPIVGKENNIVGQVVLENRIIVGSFSKEIKDFLSMLCIQIGIILENALLYENVENNYLSTVKALANTIEAKDEYTRGHCERVTEYSILIAERLNCSKEFVKSLEFAGILHDIGKIGIPKRILHKPTKLNDEEYAIIKTHPEIGYNIICNISYLNSSLEGIYQHHERYDGKGYPKGLCGKEISLMGRILAVADTYDAMTSSRPYRKALPREVAVKEILCNRGTQFDPKIADIFISVISEDK